VSSTRPSQALLAWVARAIGDRARVIACRTLTGGLTSRVHLVTVDHGGRHACVLRSWGDELPDHARGAVPREAAILTALAAADLPVPRLIAATDTAPGP
jgi:hypothetical protein